MKKKLSEMTLEELHSMQRKSRGIVMGLGIAMLIACGSLFYVAIKSNNFALIAVAIGSGMSLLPGAISLGQIHTEIKSRTLK